MSKAIGRSLSGFHNRICVIQADAQLHHGIVGRTECVSTDPHLTTTTLHTQTCRTTVYVCGFVDCCAQGRLSEHVLLLSTTFRRLKNSWPSPYRHATTQETADAFFLDGMTRAMERAMATRTHPAMPVTIYYAFKQSDG